MEDCVEAAAPSACALLSLSILLQQLTERCNYELGEILQRAATEESLSELYMRVRRIEQAINKDHAAVVRQLRVATSVFAQSRYAMGEQLSNRLTLPVICPMATGGACAGACASVCASVTETQQVEDFVSNLMHLCEWSIAATETLDDIESKLAAIMRGLDSSSCSLDSPIVLDSSICVLDSSSCVLDIMSARPAGQYHAALACGDPQPTTPTPTAPTPTDATAPKATNHLYSLSGDILTSIFGFLSIADLACEMRSVCRQFIPATLVAIRASWAVMAREPRPLDYVIERFGKQWVGTGPLGRIFIASLRVSMLGMLGMPGRIPLLYQHRKVAPFITPAILERLNGGTFQLADPDRPHIIRDGSLALCIYRATCVKPGLALSYKVNWGLQDFPHLRRIAQCRLEPSDAYVVSWNHAGSLYVTVYQLADGISELKTALCATGRQWVRLYPGLRDDQLPALGRFECTFTLCRMVASVYCGIDLRAEKNLYSKIVAPRELTTDVVQLGQCDTGAFVRAMRVSTQVQYDYDRKAAETTRELSAKPYEKLLGEELATMFTECDFTSPSASYSTPAAEAVGPPLDVDRLTRALVG